MVLDLKKIKLKISMEILNKEFDLQQKLDFIKNSLHNS
jgi:hypothetical protein